MQNDACREILDTARRMVEAQVLVTGNETLFRQGPAGQWWKFRMYRNGRGYFHLNVSTPEIEGVMYSIDAIVRALNTLYGWNDDDGADGADNDAQMGDLEDHANHAQVPLAAGPAVSEEFLNLCAHRIQTACRAYLMWDARSRHRHMQHQIAILMQQIQTLTTVVSQRESAFVAMAVSEIARMESHMDRFIVPHPLLYVTDIPADNDVINILTLMSKPTGLERNDVSAHAVGLAADWGVKTVPHKCARAVLSGTPYPLIIGSLPLPSTPIFKWRSSKTDAVIYVHCGTTFHDDHRKLIANTFSDKFMDHVQHMISTRSVGIFDFYLDGHLTQHIGSLIVSKFLARLRGNVIPVLHIESIASVVKGQGAGRRMFDFCKALVLSGNLTYGLILAECLKIDFWEYRMNETTEAQAMITQLQLLYDDVCFEPLCTMRTREVRAVDESIPSPVKQLV
jgi:hypothetical protein